MIRAQLVVVALLAACQGQKPGTPVASDEKVASAGGALDASEEPEDDAGTGAGSASGSGAGTGSVTEDPTISSGGDTPDDETGSAAARAALPAWQAVVDRDRFLARRGQKGLVEGRVGGAVPVAPVAPIAPIDAGVPGAPVLRTFDPRAAGVLPDASTLDAGAVIDAGTIDAAMPAAFTWLVDDTEGDGCLAIRVALPADAKPPAEGTRVAISGAWALDEQGRWYWRADEVTPLPAGPPITDAAPPGHAVAAADAPAGARAAMRIGDGGGAILFQVLTPPRLDGDGWTIATELGDPPVARLLLPGERASYGGHDLRQPDERWQLKRATTYWVRIGKVRRPAPRPGDKGEPPLPIVRALGAPRRVP